MYVSLSFSLVYLSVFLCLAQGQLCCCGKRWQTSDPLPWLSFRPYHELVFLVDCVPLGLKRVQELGALAVLQLLEMVITIPDLQTFGWDIVDLD